MNIFAVDDNPRRAAIALCDRHVVKMILESAQMLSGAHRMCDSDPIILNGVRYNTCTLNDYRELLLYEVTHPRHPCSKWVRASGCNYAWLYEHYVGLMEEYTFRYGRQHACTKLQSLLQHPPVRLYRKSRTDFVQAMPEEYKIDNDAVVNYRQYYRVGKAHLHSWTRRAPPSWLSLNDNRRRK